MRRERIRTGMIVKYSKGSIPGTWEAEVISIGLRIGIRVYKYEGTAVSEKILFVKPNRISL